LLLSIRGKKLFITRFKTDLSRKINFDANHNDKRKQDRMLKMELQINSFCRKLRGLNAIDLRREKDDISITLLPHWVGMAHA
jgi:hypothetical protein